MAEFDSTKIRQELGIKPDQPLWVFGYGSLIWSPCFDFLQARIARACGWQRRFSLYSTHYRGTPERPGLVLGLERGGDCHGLVFQVAPEHIDDALVRLWKREMSDDGSYTPLFIPVVLDGEEQDDTHALTFVVQGGNEMYCPDLPEQELVDIIATSRGRNGTNREYLEKTVISLRRSGIHDARLEELLEKVLCHAKNIGEQAVGR